MKKNLWFIIRSLLYVILLPLVTGLLSFQTNRSISSPSKLSNAASNYSYEVLGKWMTMQAKVMSTTIASFNGPFIRVFSYSGIAAYEAIRPGIQKKSSSYFSLEYFNGLGEIPAIDPGVKYHWPSSLNAALSFINHAMFFSTSAENKHAMDSLELTLKTLFSKDADSVTIERSAAFGKKIGRLIFNWSETDGYRFASNPYQPPSGRGKWVPTPPNFAKPVIPYWGKLRTIVKGSIDNSQPPAPPEYSEEPTSDFYKMVKEVYDVDQNMTKEQKEIALFWKDINPGFTAPGHWLHIMQQVFQKKNARLDQAAFAYALSGMALNDAWISCWKTRYDYNLLRPVTYIRNVMGHKEWLPFIPTPPHPEYTAGFAAMAGAIAESLITVFGDQVSIIDHTYDDFGMKPRSFGSLLAIAREAADSKFYGGIHYKLSVDVGLEQGRKVAQNIENILFQKRKSATP
ncbi:MAG TPA: vanadium-dependent haloperoxidase [Flavitalea sp.]|nr:vanadium-dependent haloperoxidase [Flavitalea sp.]